MPELAPIRNKPNPKSGYFFQDNILWFQYAENYKAEGMVVDNILYLLDHEYFMYTTYEAPDGLISGWMESLAGEIRKAPDFIKNALNNLPAPDATE